MRFSKSLRITHPGDFESILKGRPRRHEGGAFTLFWREGEKRRLGVAVSRQVNRAARRNRLKRIVREFFRLHLSLFPLGDNIVIAKKRADGLTNAELRRDLDDLLRR